MNSHSIDIIVPVWNRPVETRDCLVTLMEHTPGARLILVDNGSDRETERLLQEFAEILDDRALLLRNDVNQGYIRAVNRGLARAEADISIVVRNTSRVTAGWLEPLVAFAERHPEAGVVTPHLIQDNGGRSGAHRQEPAAPHEVSHGNLAVMLVKKELFERIGGLSEEMDGGVWCLKDYSRRAFAAGSLTWSVPASVVLYRDEILFGSEVRRAEALQRSMTLYRQKWGEELAYCLHFPQGADLNVVEQKFPVILTGARQGCQFHLLVRLQLYRAMQQAGFVDRHDNIRVHCLPRIMPERGASKVLAALTAEHSTLTAVTGIDGIPFPGAADAIPFADLARRVNSETAERYNPDKGAAICAGS
ncbi:glycosyltransferase family 2 protein [Geobacter sp. AOG1]|uniref:glycosyltransferase family 2 protein n=1 Tax=Geobacter sp. AOG1 TaxID=1566346 RepID=UPI001CC34F51|nr:glycosyltransferase [Geobacter sp. AOG1]